MQRGLSWSLVISSNGIDAPRTVERTQDTMVPAFAHDSARSFRHEEQVGTGDRFGVPLWNGGQVRCSTLERGTGSVFHFALWNGGQVWCSTLERGTGLVFHLGTGDRFGVHAGRACRQAGPSQPIDAFRQAGWNGGQVWCSTLERGTGSVFTRGGRAGWRVAPPLRALSSQIPPKRTFWDDPGGQQSSNGGENRR